MKKILLLVAIASLGFASCTDEQIDQNSQQNGINFKTMVGRNGNLKIDEITTSVFDRFVVSSYNTGSDTMSYTASLVPYINNLPVFKSGADWVYTGSYYWPNTDKLQFFATDATGATFPTTTVTGYPHFHYTIAGSAATQKDVLVAMSNNKSAQGTTPVALTFKHALTQMNFSVKGAEIGPTYVIKKIELIGAKDDGVCQFNDSLIHCWEQQIGNATYTYFTGSRNVYNTLISFGNGSGVDDGTLTGHEALMLMPQDGDNITLKVTYDLINSGVTLYSDATASVLLSAIHFNMSKKIRFNLTVPTPTGITNNRITFTATVSDWDVETPYDYITVQ